MEITGSNNSIQDFQKKLNLNKDQLIKIGEGGMGIVYLDPSYPDRLFKISKRYSRCQDWSREYKIYNEIQSLDPIGTNNVTLLQLYDFQTVNNTGCILELERVINPINHDLNYTIQPVFGILNQDNYTEGRGRYLGVNNLINEGLLTYDEIRTIAYDLGLTLGELHYKDKIDGIDLELFVGQTYPPQSGGWGSSERPHEGGRPGQTYEGGRPGQTYEGGHLGHTEDDHHTMVFFADFDQASLIDPRAKGSIDTLLISIDAFSYFPNPDQTPELYLLFKDGYLHIAEETGYLDIAGKVLEMYE